MTTVHMGPGNAVLTLLLIEEHFVSSMEPLRVVVSHDDEDGIIQVTGLPYFDKHGNVELPFTVVKTPKLKLDSLAHMKLNKIGNDIKNELEYIKKQARKGAAPPARVKYKGKFNSPSRVQIIRPIRTRSNC